MLHSVMWVCLCIPGHIYCSCNTVMTVLCIPLPELVSFAFFYNPYMSLFNSKNFFIYLFKRDILFEKAKSVEKAKEQWMCPGMQRHTHITPCSMVTNDYVCTFMTFLVSQSEFRLISSLWRGRVWRDVYRDEIVTMLHGVMWVCLCISGHIHCLCSTVMALLCIPVPELVSFAFSTIPICRFFNFSQKWDIKVCII